MNFAGLSRMLALAVLSGAAMGVLLPMASRADEVPKKKAEEPADPDDSLHRLLATQGSVRGNPFAAARFVATRDPLQAAFWLWTENWMWGMWKLDEADEREELAKLKFSPTLNPELVKYLGYLDKKPVPFLMDRKGGLAERKFVELFSQAAVYAQYVPTDAFAASAKMNPNVTWGHLYQEYKTYWGKEVTLEGKLMRVRQREAPNKARAKGVETLYEGWVQTTTPKSDPVAVIFLHLPDSIQVAETLTPPVQVTFHSYFLGRFAYRAADKKDHIALLLVAPTLLTKEKAAAPAESPWSPLAYLVLFGILGIIVVVIFLAVTLNVMYRKGDRSIRDKLAKLQAERAGQTLEDAPPPEGNGVLTDPGKPG
jgi:hypothetical protein